MSAKYFHELTEDEFEKLMSQGVTWGEVALQYPQPIWCGYYNALDGPMGCWSLTTQQVTGEDFCKGKKCDCYKGKMIQAAFEEIEIAEDIMPRNQSFMLTKEQYRNQTKTVTRRLSWKFAKVGDVVNGCEKCQGLKKGEKIVVMGQHRFVDLRWERLDRMIDEPEYGKIECIKEGFPDMTPQQFVEMFCKVNKCSPMTVIHRMEFEYL